jgi:cytochrome P450
MNVCYIVRSRAILHDENIYSDPWSFRPERFIKTNSNVPEADPASLCVYGYGRR